MSYSEEHGWSDERLAAANEKFDSRLNRVEMDVLLAVSEGGCETAPEVVTLTGLTLGQVQQAAGVLRAQGMVTLA